MKVNELRVGNWITDISDLKNIKDRQIDLDDFAMFRNFAAHPLPFKPILLTEEWLLKFGFTKKQWGREYVYFTWTNKEGFILEQMDAVKPDFENRLGFKAQFVHQLQNFYHALTGQEL